MLDGIRSRVIDVNGHALHLLHAKTDAPLKATQKIDSPRNYSHRALKIRRTYNANPAADALRTLNSDSAPAIDRCCAERDNYDRRRLKSWGFIDEVQRCLNVAYSLRKRESVIFRTGEAAIILVVGLSSFANAIEPQHRDRSLRTAERLNDRQRERKQGLFCLSPRRRYHDERSPSCLPPRVD